ncbi:MAG: hypothetical protein Ct9H90mP25_3870 [Gammaproteobacteria bacterium]|nr:MAG: hypothetical protein Ct9H90mP25_3870 [Gammaproteobacteria bacterium]
MRTDFDGLELYADTNGIQEAGGTTKRLLVAYGELIGIMEILDWFFLESILRGTRKA